MVKKMKIRKITTEQVVPLNIVSNPEIYSRKTEIISEEGFTQEVKVFAEDGLFSQKIFGNLNTEHEYACDCGKFTGKIYESLTCDICNTEVQLVEANINKMGWIYLKDYFIMKYISYMLLEKVVGRDNLKKIIKILDKITIDGDLDVKEVGSLRGDDPEAKYHYIGTQEFKNNYAEILEYYFELNHPEVSDKVIEKQEIKLEELDKKITLKIQSGKDITNDLEEKESLEFDIQNRKNKKERRIYESLLDPDQVFTNKIPVISTVLRPAMRTAEGLKMDKLNNIYINILTSAKILDDKTNNNELAKIITLEELQAQYFQLSEEILENIKSKSGLIRNQIMGTRINFSARNIISPAIAGYKIDEVVLPYVTFLTLYKFEIMNILTKIKKIKFVEAERVWYNATLKVDEEIYKIIKKMITDEEIGILLNRNPTISYGSILYLRIAGVKHDYDDFTMSIHNGILSLLAGDFDGDVLNIVSLKDTETKELMKEVFSPVNLIIDSNNGNFNASLNLERDQVLGLNSLLL
jgi:DNA-directed RNA polymerase beta' subunit